MRYATDVLRAATVFAVIPFAVQAYIGPGLGTGVIASVLGVLGSILLVMIAVVYYPIKRLLRRRGQAGRQSRQK